MTRREAPPAIFEAPTAEKAVLGALLKTPSFIWQVAGQLRADHFALPVHRLIYGVVYEIANSGKAVSFNLVTARLPNEDDQIGSMASYLGALIRDAEEIEQPGDFLGDILEAAGRRGLLSLAGELEKAARDRGKNVAEILALAQEKLTDAAGEDATTAPVPIAEYVKRVMTRSAEAAKTDVLPGFDTGLPSMDEITGRFHGGDLVSIIASQGDGKTVLGMQLLSRSAYRLPALMVEGEMSGEDVTAREIAQQSGVPISTIEEGSYVLAEYQTVRDASAAVAQRPIYIMARPKITLPQIRLHALALKRRHGLGMIVVDHLRLIRSGAKTRDKWEERELVTLGLKQIAKELDVVVVLLVQRTRTGQRRDDPTPQIDDAEAPSVEQDSDIVVGLWRRELWLRRNKPAAKLGEKAENEWRQDLVRSEGVAEMVALKRRRGRAHESRRFRFDGANYRIKEIRE